MNRIAIRRVGIFSAMKFGCVIGALVNLLPSIVVAIIAKWIIAALRALLESWQNIELGGVLGQTLRTNLIPILKLDGALKLLQGWDSASWLIVVAIILALSMFGGAIVAAISGLIAGAFNLIARLSGGIELELATAPSMPTIVPCKARAWLTGAGLPASGWLLQADSIRIGRDASNQLVLASPSVAPVHAELVRLGERWIVRDLGGGTFVNDRPIHENMLKDGFRIRLGEVELVFHLS